MKKIKEVLILVLIFALGCNNPNNNYEIFKDINPTEIVKNPDSTSISPILNTPIKENENIVFCASFHLLWDELEDEFNGKIELSNDVNYVEELNNITYKDEIDDKDYIAIYGESEKAKSKIIKQVKRKFGRTIELKDYPKESYLLYAYLLKGLPFETVFEADTMSFKGEKVKSVRCSNNEANEQVELLFLGLEDGLEDFNKDEFILRFQPKNPNEEIIIAKLEPEETLKETYEKVEKQVRKGKYTLSAFSTNYNQQEDFDFPVKLYNELIMFPEFNLELNANFSELVGNRIIQTDKLIGSAEQKIRFVLNEKGAELESEAESYLVMSIEPFDFPKFTFDDRFLIYIKEKKSKLPYLVIWVDNAQVLCKTQNATNE